MVHIVARRQGPTQDAAPQVIEIYTKFCDQTDLRQLLPGTLSSSPCLFVACAAQVEWNGIRFTNGKVYAGEPSPLLGLTRRNKRPVGGDLMNADITNSLTICKRMCAGSCCLARAAPQVVQSSTLAAAEKFSDSLTGRKRNVHMVPVLVDELGAFGVNSLDRRLLHGGLPSALLSRHIDREFYSEWLDSYFDRELSRPTVMAYLEVMETTHVLTLVRPWTGGTNDRDLVQMPKAFAFDTGFVCHAQGIVDLRPDDRGLLIEHLVLETLQSMQDMPRVHYWSDKDKREIDFVLTFHRGSVDAIEVVGSKAATGSRKSASRHRQQRRNLVLIARFAS
jgi:hypothetical protein